MFWEIIGERRTFKESPTLILPLPTMQLRNIKIRHRSERSISVRVFFFDFTYSVLLFVSSFALSSAFDMWSNMYSFPR